VQAALVPGTGDGLRALAPDDLTGRREEAYALVRGALSRTECVNRDRVHAGEQQVGEINVVLLQQRSTFIKERMERTGVCSCRSLSGVDGISMHQCIIFLNVIIMC